MWPSWEAAAESGLTRGLRFSPAVEAILALPHSRAPPSTWHACVHPSPKRPSGGREHVRRALGLLQCQGLGCRSRASSAKQVAHLLGWVPSRDPGGDGDETGLGQGGGEGQRAPGRRPDISLVRSVQMGSAARCPSHSRSRLASKPFPPRHARRVTYTDQARGSGPSLAGNWLGARAGLPASPSSFLGVWHGVFLLLCVLTLSPSVASTPMPKREREGVLAENALKFLKQPLSPIHTHTHTLTPNILASSLLTSRVQASTRLKEARHPPPLHTTPEPVRLPGHSLPAPAPPPARSPLPLQCSNSGWPASPKSLPGERWHNSSSLGS